MAVAAVPEDGAEIPFDEEGDIVEDFDLEAALENMIAEETVEADEELLEISSPRCPLPLGLPPAAPPAVVLQFPELA